MMLMPQWGSSLRPACEVLSCERTATHWVEDGENGDNEYCYEHAERFYQSACRKYQKINAASASAGAGREGPE